MCRRAVPARAAQHPGLGAQPLRPQLGAAGERRRRTHHALRHRAEGGQYQVEWSMGFLEISWCKEQGSLLSK